MKFKTRPVSIEAFQMTREARADRSTWPEWISGVFVEGNPNFLPYSVYASQGDKSDGTDPLSIVLPKGTSLIGWGDWIVRLPGGQLAYFDDERFGQFFAPVVP